MAEKLIFTLLAVLLSACELGAALAQPARVDSVEVELVAETQGVVAGQPLRLGLRIRHDPHWHTYWRNPGDSGLPTVIDLKLPAGYVAGPIEWPAPQRLPVGPLTNFGYEGQIVLPITLTVPAELAAGTQHFKAHAQWLVCKDVCIPGEAQLSLSLPAIAAGTAAAAPPRSSWSSLFEAMAARTPTRTAVWQADLLRDPAAPRLLLARSDQSGGQPVVLPERVEFFPYQPDLIENSAAQAWATGELAGRPTRALELTLANAVDRSRLEAAGFFAGPAGVLVLDGQPVEVKLVSADLAGQWQRTAAVAVGTATTTSTPVAATGTVTNAPTISMSLALALVFAVIGGLILNLMPCVFPVVGLKVMGFAQAAQGSRREAMRHAMLFAAGVLLSFVLLAIVLWMLRSLGEAVGWGFQLQSPWFVMLMALLFIAIGLNLSGLFEFGLSLTRVGGVAGGQPSGASSFASGVLAVVVATPCTAPFMGSALGFTLSQPLALTLLVFAMMGLGMSLPYLLLGAFPGWSRWLPKPGRWMESLRQLLAFPMYATAVWLAWVLAQQAGVDALLVLGTAAICLSIAAWIYGRFVQRSDSARAPALMWVAVSLLSAVWAMLQLETTPAVASSSAAGAAMAGKAPSENATSSGPSSATAHSTFSRVNWQAWSAQAVTDAIAQGRPVFVDFTAAWCVSCQVNKKLVLERPAVVDAFKQHNTLLLRADWTSRDARITEALAGFGRNGVPLYLVYTAARPEPQILPELLTTRLVLEALSAVR